MQGNLLERLRAWQQQGRRSVEINMGEPGDNGLFKIWVYDFDLQEGQFIQSADEIDLEGKKKQKEIAEYERLKKQFEGEATA